MIVENEEALNKIRALFKEGREEALNEEAIVGDFTNEGTDADRILEWADHILKAERSEKEYVIGTLPCSWDDKYTVDLVILSPLS